MKIDRKDRSESYLVDTLVGVFAFRDDGIVRLRHGGNTDGQEEGSEDGSFHDVKTRCFRV
jgi:hypothetical protein